MKPEIYRNGSGWHAEHIPYTAFDTREQAEQAATLPVAEAYSYGISVRTLATGKRLLEWICEVKVRCPYMPYTSEERAYVDGLVEARLEQRRAKARSATPVPTSGLDWLWQSYTRPQNALAKIDR